ncbi:hypothetical protein L2D01_05950 [Hyphomonadaceae bacterium ML37]|nr:hypothetical protein L2D01_05950 [Hyphomonadaceae bacterium ML37]
MGFVESFAPMAVDAASRVWSLAAPAAPAVGPGVGGVLAWMVRAGRARADAKREIAIALVQVQSDLARLYFTRPGRRLNGGNEVPEPIVKEIFGQYRARIMEQSGVARGQGLSAPICAVINTYAMKVKALGSFWADRSNIGDGYRDSYLRTKQHLINCLEALGQYKAYRETIKRIEDIEPIVESDDPEPIRPAGFTAVDKHDENDVRAPKSLSFAPASS